MKKSTQIEIINEENFTINGHLISIPDIMWWIEHTTIANKHKVREAIQVLKSGIALILISDFRHIQMEEITNYIYDSLQILHNAGYKLEIFQ